MAHHGPGALLGAAVPAGQHDVGLAIGLAEEYEVARHPIHMCPLQGRSSAELSIEVTLRLYALEHGPNLAPLEQPRTGKVCGPTTRGSHGTMHVGPIPPVRAVSAYFTQVLHCAPGCRASAVRTAHASYSSASRSA